MTRCKYLDCGWCYCKTGNSNDINGKCMSPMECQQLASQQQSQQHAAIEDKVMNDEKMREEFELAWQVSRSDDEGNLGERPTRSKVDGDRYAGDAAQFAWLWWQRSRAALCVELPSFENGSLRGYDGDCNEANMVIDCIADSLDAAGVRYK